MPKTPSPDEKVAQPCQKTAEENFLRNMLATLASEIREGNHRLLFEAKTMKPVTLGKNGIRVGGKALGSGLLPEGGVEEPNPEDGETVGWVATPKGP